MKKLKCILLVDDNDADNYFHKLVINEMNITDNIQVVTNGFDALEYLNNDNNILPELVFLDINMPKMSGWEFIEEFKKIDPVKRRKIVVVILSTSINPDDYNRAQDSAEISDFETKPLDAEAIENIIYKFF